jgi:hypothetical protein
MRRLRLAAALLGVAIAAVFVTTATAHHRPAPGFKTSQAAMLDCPTCKSVTPIITVGETLPGSTYRFESIPDGISIVPGKRGGDDDDDDGGKRTAEILVNHETSTVPFPFTPATGVGFNDFDNSQLSRLTLNTRTAGVLSGFFAIPSSANYQRFCSNFMATKQHGFSRPLLFTNEEATDLVNRTGTAWPAGPGAEQAGVVVAYDPRNGQFKTIYGMGRHNHENSVALPGYRKPVILSGDDTFAAPSSQLYLYLAKNADAVWNDQGSLWAFKSDNPTVNDYGDLSGSASVSGTFIPVPRDIAVGDQNGLENWSNTNNVFQFIRLEDIAYDRKKPNVVYMADTGEPRAIPNPATGRLQRGPAAPPAPLGQWSNGRIFKFEFDKKDPTRVKKLSILIDGDALGAAGVKRLDLIHQPDNLETTKGHLYIQEDPGGHNQYAIGDPNGTTARIWDYDLEKKKLRVLATVNQGADEGPTDTDPTPAALWGAWESSGIVDASSIFGKGALLVDIQAPTLVVERQVVGTITFEREGGQLLLIRLGKGGGGHHDDDDDDD